MEKLNNSYIVYVDNQPKFASIRSAEKSLGLRSNTLNQRFARWSNKRAKTIAKYQSRLDEVVLKYAKKYLAEEILRLQNLNYSTELTTSDKSIIITIIPVKL